MTTSPNFLRPFQGIGRALAIGSGVLVALATLTPSSQPASPAGPCLVCGELGGVDVILNVLLFAPLGLGLALARVQPRYAIGTMWAATLLIELIQRLAIPGRDATIGDVLANGVGGMLGFWMGAHAAQLVRPSAIAARVLTVGWMSLWLGVQALSSWAMQPSPTGSEYFGQHMRVLGREAQYSGRILHATIAGHAFPDWELRSWRQVRASLAADSGAPLNVVFESGAAPVGTASIARIKDAHARDILRFGSLGTSATYAVRTRADDLRLRPLEFRLRQALPDVNTSTTAHETVRASALYTRSRVVMQVERDARATRAETIRVGASRGWRLLSPVELYVDGSFADDALDAAWVAAFMALAGYWMSLAVRGAASRLALAAAVSFTLVAGLYAVPAAFQLTRGAWWEFAAAAGGIAMGAVTASRVRASGGRHRHLDPG